MKESIDKNSTLLNDHVQHQKILETLSKASESFKELDSSVINHEDHGTITQNSSQANIVLP